MADDQSLHSSKNPHFFQPLLPGFHTHLNIPVAFFLKHVQGRNDHIKTAKLTTDASVKTWLVKIDGLKLTDGWEEFVVAHELRIGDITIFRHEGGMVFHVTVFGPSFCDIQYTSASSSHNTNDDSQVQTNNTGTESSSGEKRKRVKKTPRTTKEESSSDHSQFVAHVSPSSLRCDRLYVPTGFARSNGLDKMSGKEIVLLNEEGRSWNLNMTYNKASMQTFVRPGWRRFCAENGMNKGHQYTFKLVRKSAPPVIRLSHAEHEPKPAPESSLHHSYYIGSVSSNSLKVDKLYIQRNFVTENGLEKGCCEITLKNEWGGSWILGLKHYESHNHTYLGPGWKTFCQINGIKAGDSFMLKLVETGDKPVLLLCSSSTSGKTPLEFSEDSDDVDSLSSDTSSGDDNRGESQESEEESRGDKNSSQECLVMEKHKNSLRCICSSPYSIHRFVRLTLRQNALKNYVLHLPLGFTRVNGINKPGKITLLGKDGVRKVVDLLKNKGNGMMRLGKGWRDFCHTNDVKVGESFLLELIWEEEAIPVLKFCNKL